MSLIVIASIVAIIIILIFIFSTQSVNKNGKKIDTKGKNNPGEIKIDTQLVNKDGIEIDIQGNNNSGKLEIDIINLKNAMDTRTLFSIKITTDKQTIKIPQLSFPLPPTHKFAISYESVKGDFVNLKIKNNGVDITDKLFYLDSIWLIAEDKSKHKAVQNGQLIWNGIYALY